jgi:Mor family transcriptional regulator
MSQTNKMLKVFYMLKAGASVPKVSRRYSISESAVKRVLRGTHKATQGHGRPREPLSSPRISKEAAYIAKGMYADGKAVKEIVEKTGLSKSTVYRIVK